MGVSLEGILSFRYRQEGKKLEVSHKKERFVGVGAVFDIFQLGKRAFLSIARY
ncbi:hypothetical protein [Rahnella ecdela]|uniref:Uncharacterized protein n=1 Tax=Rahnella ecdela TaxID=2816250 RepID=A0ABS6LBS1_9GAMM|nr:hypothetical protein [Rahnella ecdela]MBU9844185.1 hypothetical protein [Rahnella ecdela]